MSLNRLITITTLLVLSLALGGCIEVGDLIESEHKIELDDHDSLRLDLRMAAGELRLESGTRDLMECYFEYNVDRWRPEVDYSANNGQALVFIEQEKRSRIPLGNAKNRWEIVLNDDIPMDVRVKFGAGEGRLDFSGLTLKTLDIDMGVGDLTLDLSGHYFEDIEVDLDGGVGSATLYLPEDIGVRVDIDGGLGSVDASGFEKAGHVYTNEAYGRSVVTIDIRIDAGIGSIDLRLK
jgi:hypothetical protein